MKLDRHTTKLFYVDPYLVSCQARIVKLHAEWVELTDTVAYPEGGGQDCDQGAVTLDDGVKLRFVQVKKIYGHPAGLAGFPDIRVGGIVLHQIHEDDRHLLARLVPGSAVTVMIDRDRRAALSLSHSASHVLYLAVGMHRPDAVADTLGCHIKVGNARFDFGVERRFSDEDMTNIRDTANELVRRDAAIALTSHPDVPDARTWHCDGHAIPCGGTHIERAGAIGELVVRRKSLGAGKERIACTFPAARIETARYHG